MNPRTNLRAFNLNTLPVLREILRHGSVGKAAKALNVSQPALSGALKQLRHQFGDELIVRSRGLMKLTPKAESMLAPLESALAAVQNLILPDGEDSSAPSAVLRIATNDHIMNILGGPLVKMILQEKTGILPHFLVGGGHSVGQLLNDEVDFLIAPRILLAGARLDSRDQNLLNSELLFKENLVGIGPGDDKTLAEDMTVEDYLACNHVSLNLDTERSLSVEQVILGGNSFKQNDVARFGCYASLVGVVVSTGCIALVPESLAKATRKMCGLQIFTPPIVLPPLEWVVIWHRRNDNDIKMSQFRTMMKSCALHLEQKFEIPKYF